jgi:hypothetical protein
MASQTVTAADPIPGPTRFPDGARFAFTILDDTDDSTLENARPVYDRLAELGFRTTKTVWPVGCPEGSRNFFAADTLERPEYLEWVHQLVEKGFELALHGATMESSRRERTQRGLELMKREFGAVPRLYANHGFNRENLYWGAERFRTPWLRRLIERLGGGRERAFEGEDPTSAYFWGDLCLERIEYVRGFTFAELDLLRADPRSPYRQSDTPYVRSWFSTADAPDAATFKRRVTRRAIDRLESDGGVCILSTHLGKGFANKGRLDLDVDAILTDISRRKGWFVPVTWVLDHLRAMPGRSDAPLSPLDRTRLELRFLWSALLERLGGRLGGS